MENAVVLVVVLVYFAAMFGLGWWANRRMKSAKEFLIAGQSLGFFVMAIASFSSIQSGWGMVGATGQTYSWGLQALVAVALAIPIAFTTAWFLLGTRLSRAGRVHQIFSVPDVIRVRFHDPNAHRTMSIAVFLGSIAYMTAQVTAIGVIMSLLFGISLTAGAWIGSIIVAFYTMAGGMLAAVWTDLIQGLLMIVMSIGVFFIAINSVGGWSNMLSTIGASDIGLLALDGSQPTSYIFAFMLLMFLGAAGQPQLLTKFLMLRDTNELRWGAAVAGIAYAVTTLFSVGVGLATRALSIEGRAPELENIDNTATWFLDSMTSPVVGGIALTGLLAAIMSSASSFITIGASAMMRDITSSFGIRVQREVLWGRICSAVVVLAALLFALYLSQVVFLLGALGWAAFGAAILGPIVLAMYWRRATAIASTITVAFAILANLVLTALTSQGWLTLPNYFQIGALTITTSVVLFIAISWFTTNRSPEATLEHFYGDPRVPAQDSPARATTEVTPEMTTKADKA